MTKPQLEDGYTRIANELFEAILGYGFSQQEMAVVFAILRKTYGYGKKEDDMSASQIGEMIGKHRNHVTATIGKLAAIGVITKRQGSYGLILGVNKDYKNWGEKKALASTDSVLVDSTDSVQGCTDSVLGKVVPILLRTSTDSVQVDSTDSVHTKENLSKETNKRKKVACQELCFADWIEQLKVTGEKAIPEDHEIFSYAKKIRLPIDYVRLCWLEFRRDHLTKPKKKQASWPQTFSNYVRKGYYRLWFEKDGEWLLTTAGIQLQKEMRDER